MYKQDIIRWAREVGFTEGELAWHDEMLERFAALVAAAAVRESSAEYKMGWNDAEMIERDRCASFIEKEYVRQFEKPWREDLAAAIRARGQQ